MVPRLIFRTHYQVEEPAYIELLVKRCSSAVQSCYPEVVAERLVKEVKNRIDKDFNKAAALYAVDLAAALGVITDNNTWTDKGHLVDLLADIGEPNELLLKPREKLLHFRLFLEADGAVLLELARYFIEHGSLSHAEAIASDFVEQLFSRIYNEYLRLTTSTPERMALREDIQKLRQEGYRPKTRHHKLRIHIQTMFRLGLIDRQDNADIRYIAAEQHIPKLSAFVREITNVEVLEKRIAKNEHLSVASRVFGMGARNFETIPQELLSSLLIDAYERIASHGTPICPISTIVEAMQATLISEHDTDASFDDLLGFITHLQRTNAKQFRFHVDRRGRPSFIKIADQWLQQFKDVRA